MPNIRRLIPAIILSAFSLAAVGAVLNLVASEGVLNRAYQSAFQAEKTDTVRTAAALSTPVEASALLHLTSASRTLNSPVLGTLEKGNRFTIDRPSGGTQELEITDVRPVPVEFVAPARPGTRMMLVTLQPVDLPGTAPLHLLIEQKIGGEASGEPATRPL